MNRSHYVAMLVALVIIGGLVAVNVGGSPADDLATTEGARATGNRTTSGADATDGTTPTASLSVPPPVLGPAGDLVELDGWLQTDATDFGDFDDSVRVVQFWTFGCVNCRNTLGNLRALYDEFEPRGLEVIGVHAPEFDFEADPVAIEQAAIDLGVAWPIALDTDKTNFRAWQPGRRFWPRTFVLDRAGNIRFDRIGEGAYDELNATVAWLIENDVP